MATFKTMRCPVCNDAFAAVFFVGDNRHGRHMQTPRAHFNVYRCATCGVIGLPETEVTPEYYASYYPTGYHSEPIGSGAVLPAIWNALSRQFSRLRIERLKQFLPGDRPWKLLDVGCGPGGFLSLLDKTEFDAYGLEPVSEAVLAAQRRGLAVSEGDLLSCDMPTEAYDIVTLWHVFEHIIDPALALQRICRCLKPNGLLVLSTPNTDSLACRVGRKWWFHLDAPRHIWLYNPANLSRLATEAGFREERLSYLPFDYPLDLLWSLLYAKSLYLPFFIVLKPFDRENMLLVFRKL